MSRRWEIKKGRGHTRWLDGKRDKGVKGPGVGDCRRPPPQTTAAEQELGFGPSLILIYHLIVTDNVVRRMDPVSFLIEVKHNFLNERGSYDVFLQTIKDFKAQKIDTNLLIKDLTNLFHGKQSLILGFNEFLPKEYKIVSKEDEEALSFVKRVKTTFKDDHGSFLKFLQIMDTYSRKNKSIIEVYKEIDILFQGHDDLFNEFKTFLPDTSVKSSISPPLDYMRVKKKRKIEENLNGKRTRDKELAFFDKVKATVRRDYDTCKGLMKRVELHRNRIINRQELQDLVDDLIGEYPQLVKGFDAFMEKNSEKAGKSEGVCSSKYMEKKFEGLDLFKCEKISPSYRRLPMKYRKPDIMHESLNDGIVCVSPVKGDFKFRPKNQYANTLFKCEDEIYELDMQIRLITETIRRAEALLPEVEKSHKMGKNSYLCLEEHFSAPQLECIKKLFKRRRPQFLDSLRVKAYILLPIALKRLILKQVELAQIHKDSAVKWHNTFQDNQSRSLGFK